jgi:hypothetical protein
MNLRSFYSFRQLESQQLGVEANRRVAKIQGEQRDAATLYASLADVNYQVNTTSQGQNQDLNSCFWFH